jgi:hypothetical protein
MRDQPLVPVGAAVVEMVGHYYVDAGQSLCSPSYTRFGLFPAAGADIGGLKEPDLPLKRHRRTTDRTWAKSASQMMKLLKDGGGKKMMRQMEALQKLRGGMEY